MSRSYITLPSGLLVDAELAAIAGASVLRQTMEACPPRQLISTNFTRPADTTAYTAGDAITNSTSAPVALTFANVGRYNGAGGEILAAIIVDSANQATKLKAELWLFSGAAAPTPDNDNAVFTPTDAELQGIVLGVISLDGTVATQGFAGDATAGAGGNVVITSGAIRIPYKCGAATTSLFGLLVARNAYTPVSAEVFYISLLVEQE